jgi:hypothetical protein
MEGLIGDIPWGIGYSSEEFGLVSLDESYEASNVDLTYLVSVVLKILTLSYIQKIKLKSLEKALVI